MTPALGENKKTIMLLLNIMVAHWFRRKGVGANLLEEAKKDADVIISPSASDEGGRELLKSSGFIYNEKIDMWIFTKQGG